MKTITQKIFTSRKNYIKSFTSILGLVIALAFSSTSFAQNAIVGTGFSTGWGGGSCSTGNGNFKYLAQSFEGSYSVTTTANGTGNQYFRFGIDWGGKTAQLAITHGVDTPITPNQTYQLNTNCTIGGGQVINVGNRNYNYIFKTLNAGMDPTGKFTFFEVQGDVRSVTSVTQLPLTTSVTPGASTVVSANLDGTLSAGQAVYLRYSDNGYSNSTVVKMTGSGTSYSGTIPTGTNIEDANVSYYVFTSGTANVADNGSNADFYTINLNNNGGTNYTYSVTTTPPSTTWTSTWSNGIPNAYTPVTIAADYTGSSFESKSLRVNAGKTLTVPSTGFVKAENIYNYGNILVSNNGNFVQTGTFEAYDSSTFKVNRTTKDVARLDYNSWSSPMKISDQFLKDFSPETLLTRFLTYNNNKFEAVTSPATTKFTPGAGYLIRTSNVYTGPAKPFEGQFVGTVPNSGDVIYAPSIGGNYVFLGNPYPSAISMEDFYNENISQMETATFYIWNSQAKMNTSNVYVNPYVTQTIVGPNPVGPAYYVPVGQGFLVDRGTTRPSSSFIFKNSMRRTAETGTFAKTSVTDRFWLQMTSPAGLKPQLLVGFTPNATSGYDAGYDGKLLESNGDVIYSTVDDKTLVINALGTFSSSDEIKISSNFTVVGNYTMSIAQKEGLFESGQKIYLKDHLTGTDTELTAGDYTFAATAGLNTDRFTVVFAKPVLVTSDVTKNQVTIYVAEQTVHIKSSKKLASLEVYEMSGKLLKTAKNINSQTASILVSYKGVAVVKMVMENGEVVTKKIIIK